MRIIGVNDEYDGLRKQVTVELVSVGEFKVSCDEEVMAQRIIKSLQETYKLDNNIVYVTSTPTESCRSNLTELLEGGRNWWTNARQPRDKLIATNPRSVTLNYTDGSHYTLKHVSEARLERLKDGSSVLTLLSKEKRSQTLVDGITEQLSVDSTTIDTRLLKSVTVNEIVDGFKQSREVML